MRNVGSDEEDDEDRAALEKSIDDSTPPGTAYVELLQTINQQALPGKGFYVLHFRLATFFLSKSGKIEENSLVAYITARTFLFYLSSVVHIHVTHVFHI